MKNNIKSFVFLIAILFSFSVSAYNSLTQYTSFDHSLKRVHLDATENNNLTTDNIIFEELENENDNEDFLTEAFLLLPFSGLNFDISHKPTSTFQNAALLISEKPIYISIRVLRL